MLISLSCKHCTYRLSMIANNDYNNITRNTVYKHHGKHKVRLYTL